MNKIMMILPRYVYDRAKESSPALQEAWDKCNNMREKRMLINAVVPKKATWGWRIDVSNADAVVERVVTVSKKKTNKAENHGVTLTELEVSFLFV